MNKNKNYWWKDAIIYEVYVDKFADNFRGLAEKLNYLSDLGINCIWLLPHFPSPMVDDGYDVSNYYNVRNGLGSLDDFEVFIKAAHARGIRVIIDLVLNHFSTEHPWFKEARHSVDNPKRDYFIWSKTGKELSGSYNPFFHLTPGNWIYNSKTDDYYYASFFAEQADLNWDNPDVFGEIIKIINFWAGLGVDGFRLDAVAHLIKREGTSSLHQPEVHNILKDMRRHLDVRYPGVIMLAEANGKLEQIATYFGKGNECHMVFNFPLMPNIYLAVKRNNLKLLESFIKNSPDIPDNCQWATFVNNHDEITFALLEESMQEEIISWLDPKGEFSFKGGRGVAMRLASIFKNNPDLIVFILSLLFSLPGAPVIYYGSEIGMENLARENEFTDSRRYVRGQFDWLQAEEQMRDSNSLLNRVKEIIRQRKERQTKVEKFLRYHSPGASL
ncbi:MAG: trehalose synthase [Candidatus Yanofskybacteria bacterium]|nr:trehalose synthase [Candidatus Yanofskybacteria bacterium]